MINSRSGIFKPTQHVLYPECRTTGHSAAPSVQTTGAYPASIGAGSGGGQGVGSRFVVDLESGKPTVRLENVLHVVDALGGQLELSGMPERASSDLKRNCIQSYRQQGA